MLGQHTLSLPKCLRVEYIFGWERRDQRVERLVWKRKSLGQPTGQADLRIKKLLAGVGRVVRVRMKEAREITFRQTAHLWRRINSNGQEVTAEQDAL